MRSDAESRTHGGFEGVRDWLAAVEDLDELKRIEGADWTEEIGAITELYQRNPGTQALLFDEVPGYPSGYRVLSCIMNSPARIALTFGMDPDISLQEITARIRGKFRDEAYVEPRIVDDGPVLENVHEGDDVDVYEFPSPMWHERDAGRFIGTADIVVTTDPDGEWVNFGTYRSVVHDEDEVGLLITTAKHGRGHVEAYHEQGDDCPVAIVPGVNPELYAISGIEVPRGKSEYAYAGWWRGEPVDVIESGATGLPVPAAAEIVLEGRIRPGNVREDGPFGEWTGYYATGGDEAYVVDIERVLHRDDPIITGSPPSKPPCEEVYYRCPARSANVWNTLDDLGIPGIEGVWTDPAGGSHLWVVVAIDQEYAGHARQVGQLTSQIPQNAYMNRFVIVVDDDVDPTDRAEVLWAVCTRVHPPRDIHVVDRSVGSLADPIPYQGTEYGAAERTEGPDQYIARTIIDATRSWESAAEFPPVAEITPELRERILSDWPELFGDDP